jgi:uncharacterized protein YjbI with pentapeptide repeats
MVMANTVDEENLKDAVKKHFVIWNLWRRNNPTVVPDLRSTNLRDANLSGINLRDADLTGANLIGAYLGLGLLNDVIPAVLNDLLSADILSMFDGKNDPSSLYQSTNLRGAKLVGAQLNRADLNHTVMSGANLSSAFLDGTHLRDVDLRGADLSGANLRKADLRSVNLSGANLTATKLLETVFVDVDLTNVVGLDRCIHDGSSIIDHRTLQRSGPLPLAFLRGVGLPDSWIEYLPSLLNQPIQHYSCFISYSSKDDEFANRIHADLQNSGVRCRFAPHDLPIGDKILDALDAAIRLRDKVVLILSEHSIKSGWVEDEVTAGFEEERKRGQIVLFPVRLDEAVMNTNEAWAAKLRARNIGDFTRWKDHDSQTQQITHPIFDLEAMIGAYDEEAARLLSQVLAAMVASAPNRPVDEKISAAA